MVAQSFNTLPSITGERCSVPSGMVHNYWFAKKLFLTAFCQEFFPSRHKNTTKKSKKTITTRKPLAI
jgi:hypothetical protein